MSSDQPNQQYTWSKSLSFSSWLGQSDYDKECEKLDSIIGDAFTVRTEASKGFTANDKDYQFIETLVQDVQRIYRQGQGDALVVDAGVRLTPTEPGSGSAYEWTRLRITSTGTVGVEEFKAIITRIDRNFPG